MKKLLLALALATSLPMTSCLGPNNAFNGLHSWNSRLSESPIVNGLVYIVGWVVPAYQLAFLSDVVVFNTVEFWGGKNPIDAPRDFTPQRRDKPEK